MKTIKVGDRVDVILNITKSWESKAGMSNGKVAKIQGDLIRVISDQETKDIPYHNRLHGGHYYTDGYKIELTKTK